MSRVKCDHCRECDAVCVGRYEDPENPLEFACHGCCGHGNEDGFCVMLAADEQAMVEIDELTEKVESLERRVTQADKENGILIARIAALESQIEIAGTDSPDSYEVH